MPLVLPPAAVAAAAVVIDATVAVLNFYGRGPRARVMADGVARFSKEWECPRVARHGALISHD